MWQAFVVLTGPYFLQLSFKAQLIELIAPIDSTLLWLETKMNRSTTGAPLEIFTKQLDLKN